MAELFRPVKYFLKRLLGMKGLMAANTDAPCRRHKTRMHHPVTCYPRNAECLARKQPVPILTPLVWRGRGPSPRPPNYEANALTPRSPQQVPGNNMIMFSLDRDSVPGNNMIMCPLDGDIVPGNNMIMCPLDRNSVPGNNMSMFPALLHTVCTC